jgi:hypothetical protein
LLSGSKEVKKMYYKKEPFVPSVGLIVFSFIFCYPLGFVFLFMRLKNKAMKSYTAVNANNEPIRAFNPNVGYKTLRSILLCVGIMFALGTLSEILNAIQYGYFYYEDIAIPMVISIACLTFAYRRTAQLRKYQPYLNYLAAYGTDPISDLAYSLGVSHEQAVRDLSDMIGKGILKASISADDYIVLDSNPAKIPSDSRYAKKFIRCPFCGAPNALNPGQARKCEYCDSPLE